MELLILSRSVSRCGFTRWQCIRRAIETLIPTRNL